MKPLHPNLARIAAEYDEVVLEARLGRITPAQANSKIAKLVAKDDQGLEWVIEPDSGKWMYKSLSGEYVFAEPPEYGFTSPTPKDIGSTNKKDFDARLKFYEVNEENLKGNGLVGATRRDLSEPENKLKKYYVFGVVITLVCVILALTVK